jgi:hypothetical protein
MSVDAMLERIDGFNRARGGGVIVRKVARLHAPQRAHRRSHRQVPAHR